eukprot:m.180160 g.180160  ORF g.180160 m.180160 type:complete len:528 (-) comp17423_c1_seq1:12-1595(-)
MNHPQLFFFLTNTQNLHLPSELILRHRRYNPDATTSVPCCDLLHAQPVHLPAQAVVVGQTLCRAERCDGRALVEDVARGNLPHSGGGDGVDASIGLGDGHAAAVGQNLAANLVKGGRGAVHLEEEAGLELGLRAGDLGVRCTGADAHPLLLQGIHKVLQRLAVAHAVGAPQTRVRVGGVEGGEAVCELFLGAEASKARGEVLRAAKGAVPAAHNRVGDHEREVVRVGPADALDCNADVGLGHAVVALADLAAGEGAGRHRCGALRGRQGGEALLGELDELVVVNAAGGREDNARSSVVLLDVALQIVAGDRADVLLGTEDGAAKRGAHKGLRVQHVKENLRRLVINLLDLAQDDVTLHVNLVLGQGRVLQNVGDNVHGLVRVLGEALDKVHRLLARGESVEVRAHVLDLDLQLVLGAARSALEGHVLKEVRGAVVGIRLEAAAGINVHANGGGLMRRLLAGDAEAALQRGEAGLRLREQRGRGRGGKARLEEAGAGLGGRTQQQRRHGCKLGSDAVEVCVCVCEASQ